MSVEITRDALLWCAVINYGVLLVLVSVLHPGDTESRYGFC